MDLLYDEKTHPACLTGEEKRRRLLAAASDRTAGNGETEGDDGQHGSLPYSRQSAENDGSDKKRNSQTQHPDDAGNIRVVGNTPGGKQQRKVLSNRVLFLGRAMTAEKSDTGTKSVPKKGTLPPGLAKSGNKSRG